MLPFPGQKPAQDEPKRPPAALLWLARTLALSAAGLAGYLWWVTAHAHGKVAGCGGATDCGHVLASRWSHWLGLPVSLPALVAYLVTFLALLAVGPGSPGATRRDAWRLLIPLAALLAAAGCWFSALQLFVLHSFCPYCLAAHACGVLLSAFILVYSPVRWRRVGTRRSLPSHAISPGIAWALLALGLVGSGALAAGQLLVTPSLGGMQVVETPPARPTAEASQPSADNTSPVAAARQPSFDIAQRPALPPSEPERPAPATIPDAPKPAQRHITVAQGQFDLDVYAHPSVGLATADHVVVKLFDYTCAHCRTTHRYLEEARRRYGDQLVIVLLPVPMNTACNKYIQVDRPEHEQSCEFARLALGVWKARPAAFADFHHWLLDRNEMPTIEASKDHAAKLVGAEALEIALADKELGRQLEENARLFDLAGNGQIPKLLTEKFTAVGEPQSAAQLFDFFEKNVGLKPAPTAAELK